MAAVRDVGDDRLCVGRRGVLPVVIIPRDHADSVCKMGEGADCCRYLMVGSGGLECAKDPANHGFRKILDRRKDSMVAKGDNCDGYMP